MPALPAPACVLNARLRSYYQFTFCTCLCRPLRSHQPCSVNLNPMILNRLLPATLSRIASTPSLSLTSFRSLSTMAPTSTSLTAPAAAAPMHKSTASIPNPVKEALKRNELTYTFTIKLLRSIEAVQLAHTAGYNSVLVDLEHAPLTLEQTGQICLAALARGMCPIVRVPQLERHWISRTLDIGALGILVPHVSTFTFPFWCLDQR